jgi:hypothetical protein
MTCNAIKWHVSQTAHTFCVTRGAKSFVFDLVCVLQRQHAFAAGNTEPQGVGRVCEQANGVAP